MSTVTVRTSVKAQPFVSEQQTVLAEKSQTAQLRLQYSSYVDLIKAFMCAERLGNWSLHLSCVAQMLSVFAAAGHFNYAKAAHLYLAMMMELPREFPWLYDKCMQGFPTVYSDFSSLKKAALCSHYC